MTLFFSSSFTNKPSVSVGGLGAGAILDSLKDANAHMKKKGGLGVVGVMLQAHDIIDIVKIILPSPAVAKQVQKDDNWGDIWVRHSFVNCTMLQCKI